MKLTEIVLMDFQIVVVDGLRIGGGGGELEIGGSVDANLGAIRDPITEEPYLPGSSIKGKLRSLLEKVNGTYRMVESPPKSGKYQRKEQSESPCECGEAYCTVCTIFGAHKNTKSRCAPTRITVRDAHLAAGSEERARLLEYKTENTVNRTSGAAKDPRTGERIPPGARFDARIILRTYDADADKSATYLKAIQQGLGLLQDADSLGSSGSRGYGTIRIDKARITRNPVSGFFIPFEESAK